MYKTLITCFILLICFFVQLNANDDIYFEKSEAELYVEATKLFDQKKYKQAIRAFQKIEDLYPLSCCAMKAKLLSGISYYNMGNYSSAAGTMEDYIQIYSNSKDLPYVYYLRVLSYCMQISKIQLDQQITYKALELATEYINLFPNSEHTDEIKGKVKLITEHMLIRDYSIGRFYLRRGEYLAAIKRFQNVISDKDSSYFSRSISHLMAAHLALGLDLEAQQYKSMLAENLDGENEASYEGIKPKN